MMVNLGRFLMLDGFFATAGGAVWSALTENLPAEVLQHGMRAITSSPPALICVAGIALVLVGRIVGRAARRS